jgi:hypothetical protein
MEKAEIEEAINSQLLSNPSLLDDGKGAVYFIGKNDQLFNMTFTVKKSE